MTDSMKPRPKQSDRKRIQRAIGCAFAVPRGGNLFVIEAALEVKSRKELDAIKEAIARVLCPIPPNVDHRCARRWAIMVHPVAKDDRAGWEPLLNET